VQRVGQSILIEPLRVAEHTVEQRVRIGLLDLAHGALQRRADVRGLGAHVAPVAVLGDLKPVQLGEPGQLLVAGLVDDLLVLLVPDIADALEEEQREDVGREVGCVHGPRRMLADSRRWASGCPRVTVCSCKISAAVIVAAQRCTR